MDRMHRYRVLGAGWGIGGVIGILCFAMIRLSTFATEALAHPLSTFQWVILCTWCLFMIISEGYDGFYKRIAPRVVSRAAALQREGTPLQLILAPLYCLHYFASEKKRVATAYTAIILIIVAVIIVHQLPQPWRGIVDCGVILGLLAGCIAITVRFFHSR